MTNAKEFLDTIFSDLGPDEHVCVSRAIPKDDGKGVWFKNHLVTDRQWRKWSPETQDQAWYFAVSSIDGAMNEKGTMVSRGRANLKHYFCLVLDDIGTKGSPPPVEPSWKVVTSVMSNVENQQWGFFLDPGDDWPKFEALVEWCAAQGWADAGAGGSYRLMRIPGSANLKPGRQMFKTKVVEWNETVWSLDELAEDLGCDLDTLPIKELSVSSTVKAGGAVAMDGIDPLLDWLVDNGHVVHDGGEWVDIICPWAESHTSGANTGGYSPLGRGSGDWVQTRAFKCLHEHCVSRKLVDLVKWAEAQGGPFVSGYDPLPWLQARYAYVGMDMRVADMIQRVSGGEWIWDFAAWAKRNPGRVAASGEKNKVKVADAFVASRDTRHVDYTAYRPVSRASDVGIIDIKGQAVLNTYVPPNWKETDEAPQVFLDHMDYLIPAAEEREIFLNWLACKIQQPDKCSYGVIMVAEDAYGTGRSWIKDMLTRALQGHVNTAKLPQLYGKGTSAEQTYNDWQACCQYLIVEEAKDSGLTRDDFYHGYETFKDHVDPKVSEDIRINPKFGRTRHENIYFNALIFTNHADAMVLPSNCRRTYVITNPSDRKDYTYYERLTGSLQTQEPRRLYWWLMRRDVSGYDRIYPPMTPAKGRMIEDTRAPSDAISEWILESHAPDLVTKNSLKIAVVMAARDLDFDKIMREPGAVTKILWRKLKSLRPEDAKNGARFMIDGKQTEIRAIRNQENWENSDKISVDQELGKNKIASNVVILAKN